MTERAEDSLAHAWRRATSRLVSGEGFLEDALAAALEDRRVWTALVRHLCWEGQGFPESGPTIRTQRAGDFGRTDIELSWPGVAVPTLILELKTQGPPSVEQVAAYLGRDDDVRLAGIAAWSNEEALRVALSPDLRERLLGVVTWTQIRQVSCADPPLALRQLHRLIDEMGVAMPHVDYQQLSGMVGTLPAWRGSADWIASGLIAVKEVCVAGGVSVSPPRAATFDNGWYAGQLGVLSSANERGHLWVGLILDDLGASPLRAGLPDLVVQLEIDTRSTLGARVHGDPILIERLLGWAAASGEDEVRSAPQEASEWTILATRSSSDRLLALPDQREGFTVWARGAVTTWAQHGILERIAMLAGATDSTTR